jgi:hypothetical protein
MIEILNKILSDIPNRKKNINEFQHIVWDDENCDELYADLALDLDFYEPDEKLRKEDPSYYGDERLEKEIRSVLEKLNS